jgi:hypothetical protein
MVFRRVREVQGVSAQEVIEPGIVVVHRVRLVHDERRRLDEGTTISKCVHHTFERLGQIWEVLEDVEGTHNVVARRVQWSPPVEDPHVRLKTVSSDPKAREILLKRREFQVVDLESLRRERKGEVARPPTELPDSAPRWRGGRHGVEYQVSWRNSGGSMSHSLRKFSGRRISSA